MSFFTRINPRGATSRGQIERVSATRQMCCARRDQMLMARYKVSSFLRKPYRDMDEAEWISNHFSGQIKPQQIEAVLVSKVIEGQTNARMPLTKEQFLQEQDTEIFLTLREAPASDKCFATN